MLRFFGRQLGVMLCVSANVLHLVFPPQAAGQPAANASREVIGNVFGKPVYRGEIRTGKDFPLEDELYRLFLQPVTRRYCAAHKTEVEPTQAEVDMVTAYFQKNGPEGNDPDEPTEDDLRQQLEDIEAQLATGSLSERRRDHLELKKEWIDQKLDQLPAHAEKDIAPNEGPISGLIDNVLLKILRAIKSWTIDEQLANPNLTKEKREDLEGEKKMIEFSSDPNRAFATFILARWKFERHLYDKYGGGRVVWQQPGFEAFDATRKWLEDEERKGNFKITDSKLRDAFYCYWTQSHHHDIIEEEDVIRKMFLEPEWAPRRVH